MLKPTRISETFQNVLLERRTLILFLPVSHTCPHGKKKKRREKEKPAVGWIHRETPQMPGKQKLLTPEKEIDLRKH